MSGGFGRGLGVLGDCVATVILLALAVLVVFAAEMPRKAATFWGRRMAMAAATITLTLTLTRGKMSVPGRAEAVDIRRPEPRSS